jgi:environmental stress-induced protein Ves
MEIFKREQWWTLIKQIAIELEEQKIPYHFDASTSVFVHGIDFDMDDIDILIQWDCFEKAHEYFKKYGATAIQNSSFSQFFFMVDNMKVHILSSERCTNLEDDNERVIIHKDNQILWSKSVSFYRRHHSDDHPLAALIDEFLRKERNL